MSEKPGAPGSEEAFEHAHDQLEERSSRKEELRVLIEPMQGQTKADLHSQLEEIADKGLRGEATQGDQALATAIGVHLSREGTVDGTTLGLLRDAFRGDSAQADEDFLEAVKEAREANPASFEKRLAPYVGAMEGDREKGEVEGGDLLTIERDGAMTIANGGSAERALSSLSAKGLLGLDYDGRRALGRLRAEDGRTAADIVPDDTKRRILSPEYAGYVTPQLVEALGLEEFARKEGIRWP